MHTRPIALFSVILAVAVTASAQDVTPPPGFVPGQGYDADPETDPTPSYNPRRDVYVPPAKRPTQDVPYLERYPGSPNPYWPGQSAPAPVIFAPEIMPLPRLWMRAEALYWWSKDSPVSAPLVTTPGAVLLGGEDVTLPGQGGGRFTFGFSLDAPQTWGLETSYFFLGNRSVTQGVSSDGGTGSAPLIFPFIDSTTGLANGSLISNPGSWAGDAVLNVQSFLQGLDANLLQNIYNVNGTRFDMLGGFRWMNLRESLSFVTDSPDLPVGTDFFHTVDQFRTNNNFYGAQIGARMSYDNSRLFMNATGKLALGATVENVRANGGTFTDIAGPFMSAPGGYLTQVSNIGSQSRTQFAVIPEVDLNFGIRMSPWASFLVGYSFVYVSSVARPGDQIDRVINPNTSPAIGGNFSGAGAAHPALNVQSSDFWAQGLNFGLEFRW